MHILWPGCLEIFLWVHLFSKSANLPRFLVNELELIWLQSKFYKKNANAQPAFAERIFIEQEFKPRH